MNEVTVPSPDQGTPSSKGASRREFVKGGALLVAFAVSGRSTALAEQHRPAAKDIGTAINGFVRIEPDGRIFLTMPSAEMGQGIYTAEATLIAEELEVDLDQIEVEAAAPDAAIYAQPLFKAQLTGGSTSIRGFWAPLREAGATARTMLVEAASERWNVNPAECVASRAVITHVPTGKTLTYASLAEEASRRQIPPHVILKSPKDFRLIGTPLKRLDTPEKVSGTAVFGIDVVVPGMKIGALAMCPVIGGTIEVVDDTETRRIPGVIDIIRIDDAVAVIAETYWIAKTGVAALQITWDDRVNRAISTATILADQKQAAETGTPIKALLNGDVEAALSFAKSKQVAVYEMPFLAHATMEPINTTVHVRPDGCDIWVGTQTPVVAQKRAARITGLPIDKVKIHSQLIGGGFGRRLQADTIEQAVALAKQVSYPIKFIWTREQDIRHDRFRPSYYDQIAAGLGADGLPVAWTHRVTSGTVREFFDEGGWPQGQLDKDAVDGAWDTAYDFPAIRVDWIRHDPPLELNWWRGVGPTHNVFVVESFMDELAHAAGQDPIAYRRALLSRSPRSIAVLDLVAQKADWSAPLPSRTARGVSLHKNFDTYAAMVVEVSVTPEGEIKLNRVVAVIDCGIQVNPDTIRAQIEGGALFGLSAALYNGITLKNGQVKQGNFNDYRQLRLNETPKIEVHLIPSDAPPGGLGEVGTVSAAPALANALFAATGVRLRRLPIDAKALAIKGSGT